MPTDYVLDASAAAKLLLLEPETPAMRQWFERSRQAGRVLVPAVFEHELRNTAAKGVSRKDIPDAETAAGMCEEFRRMVDEWPVPAFDAIRLAVANNLSTHDAAYVVLMEGGRALVTYDERLAKVARALHGADRVLSPR